VTEWKHLNLNYKIVAQIDEALCIGCQLCHIACWDGAHQCIHLDRVSGPVDGHVEVHAKPHEFGRERIVVTPIPKLDPPKLHVGLCATSFERIPRVDETECVGCNLCSLVCPVDRCITMVERDRGLASETWAERTSAVVERAG
jgi:dihydropyrimidine dehydrogenase (NAD+) subunit PreA